MAAGSENSKYQIETPKELFSLVEEETERGTELLAEFFGSCFERLSGAGAPDCLYVMVTMKKMRAGLGQRCHRGSETPECFGGEHLSSGSPGKLF